MSFRFNNVARQVGTRGDLGWYEWIVYMDESPDRLELVDRVEYQLHETFADPIRVQEDPESRFALQSAGWGEFAVVITIYLKNGSEIRTDYQLDLGKPWIDLVAPA